MRTSDGALILAQILTEEGVADVPSYGTHSAKATLLSWAAKAGLAPELRKLLGGHADAKDRTMHAYSRDVMARPLQELALLLSKVRSGEFAPDETRSGRWHPEKARGGVDGDQEGGESNATQPQAEGVALAAEPEAPDSGNDTSTSESAASASEECSNEEAEAETVACALRGEAGVMPPMPPDGIWVGSSRGTVHKGLPGRENSHAACGYGLRYASARWTNEWPTGKLSFCRQMRCFPQET